MPGRRQTQSYLRNLFATRGIIPQRQRGQNFLIDLNLHELIMKAADVNPLDVVLEVGSGAGAFTLLLAQQAALVIAVEVDPTLALLTSEAVIDQPDVQLVQADILARKSAINPEVLRLIRSGLEARPGSQLKLVSNLPYTVATSVITNFLVHSELRPSLMVVTIQLELAERMRAEPGTKAYGSLSVLVQALADFELVRVLPPTVFWPRPKVESAIVQIVPKAEKYAAISDLPWFHQVVRRVFLHRRKNLRHVLHACWRDQLTKAGIDALLQGLGFPGSVRAEALHVEEFIRLAEVLKQKIGDIADAAETEEEAGAGESIEDLEGEE
jgi:16S rRNA (adenine1518-N6/adenine1519-N6)-dimethyltransferase